MKEQRITAWIAFWGSMILTLLAENETTKIAFGVITIIWFIIYTVGKINKHLDGN